MVDGVRESLSCKFNYLSGMRILKCVISIPSKFNHVLITEAQIGEWMMRLDK